MNMLQKKIGVVLLTLLLIGLVVAWKGTKKPDPSVVTIGVILPLSGSQAAIGEALQDSLYFAQSQAADTKYNYRLVFEDDQNDPKKAAIAAQKLINVDGAKVLISEYANTGNVVSSIAKDAEIVHFGIAFDPTIAKGDLNFLHWSPPSVGAQVLLQELQARNKTNISIVLQQSQGTQAVFDELKLQHLDYEVNINSIEYLRSDDRDFRSLSSRLSNNESDIYVLLVFPPNIDILTRQLNVLGDQTPLTTVSYFELSQNRELFNGQWYVSQSAPHSDFEKEFESFSGRKVLPGVPNGYDVFNIVVQSAETLEPQEINSVNIGKKIKEIKSFYGVLGELEVLRSGILSSSASIKKIEEGRPVFVGA